MDSKEKDFRFYQIIFEEKGITLEMLNTDIKVKAEIISFIPKQNIEVFNFIGKILDHFTKDYVVIQR